MTFSTTLGLNLRDLPGKATHFLEVCINEILREHFLNILPQEQKLELNFTFSCRKELSYFLNVANLIRKFAALPFCKQCI